MKLVYKNILINTLISLLVLFVGEISLYFFLKSNIEKEAIEHLFIEKHFIEKQLNKGVDIEYFKHNIGDDINILPLVAIKYKTPLLEDAVVNEKWEEEYFTSKKITFDVMQNYKAYRISITKTIDEDEGLGGRMFSIIIISGCIMLTLLVVINVLVYNRLFSPVYKIIKEIKQFSIQELKTIPLQNTSTKEFQELGKEVTNMSEKLILDYSSIKEFTENVTHEIQTPLTVISFKIERCIQDENLTEAQAILLSDAAKSITKLFNINKGLTLLCKLDNNQYTALKEICINEQLKSRIKYFSDFFENKNISILENYSETITVFMEPSLSEIMIDNLLKNAIQHNLPNGKVFLTIQNQQLIIANTGEPPIKDVDVYFNRFYSQKSGKSLGLGLSIVKGIVNYYGFKISYNYLNELHQITIDFKK